MKITQEDLEHIKIVLAKFKEPKSLQQIFYTLCFCICVPGTRFSKTSIAIKKLQNLDFYNNDIQNLSEIIKETRFKNKKAKYLIEMKSNFDNILKILDAEITSRNKRSLLVQTVKGLGMKAASHFLRDLGYQDLAIVDTHIKKYMGEQNASYEQIELKFEEKAKEKGLTIAELDGLVWKYYSKTDWENFVF